MHFCTVNLNNRVVSSDLHTKQRPLAAGFKAYNPTECTEHVIYDGMEQLLSNFFLRSSIGGGVECATVFNSKPLSFCFVLLCCPNGNFYHRKFVLFFHEERQLRQESRYLTLLNY